MSKSSEKLDQLVTEAKELENLENKILELDVFERPESLKNLFYNFYQTLDNFKANLINISAIPVNEDEYEIKREDLELLQRFSTTNEFSEIERKKKFVCHYSNLSK